MNINIIGGGSLCRLLIDIIDSLPEIVATGIFDDRFPNLEEVAGVKVIGKFADVSLEKSPILVIGIGEPKIRKSIFEKYSAEGFHFPSLIHSSAVVSKRSKITNGVTIGPLSTILSGSVIGEASCLLSLVNINQDVSVGCYSLIGASTAIGSGATLGEGCHVAMGKVIGPEETIAPWIFTK